MNSIVSATSLMAAAAVASPIHASSIGSDENAELMQLGQQLDLLTRQWVAQRKSERQKMDVFDREVELVTGIKFKDAGPLDYQSEYWKTRRALSDKRAKRANETRDQEDGDPWVPLDDRLSQLVPGILAQKARTMSGVAIQARAAAIACQELWDSDLIENEGSLDVERIFIEAVCRYAGITPLPLETDASLTATVHAVVEADPIFAAIEDHRRAWANASANTSRLDEIARRHAGAAQRAAAAQKLADLHDAVNEGEDQLGNVVPTTMAGASALITYAATCENSELIVEIMSNLAKALPTIAT